jgi:hypothetical protein
MTPLEIKFWEFLRRVALKTGEWSKPASPRSAVVLTATGQAASNIIQQKIESGAPLMAARFGAGEIHATARYVQIQTRFKPLDYLSGRAEPNWWTNDLRQGLRINAGIFDANEDVLARFAQLMLEDAKEVDVLGCWQPQEAALSPWLQQAVKVRLEDLEPYYHAVPWSAALEGKRVLVVHPFSDSIQSQYQNRHLLFRNAAVLPRFELITLRAVQSIAASSVVFSSWFDALDHMKAQIEAINFDIAIIGCGAYGFPLAAHVKRMGKQAVHLGGATQILFGIKGKRWESMPFFSEQLINEHWVRPLAAETPEAAQSIEGGCYW